MKKVALRSSSKKVTPMNKFALITALLLILTGPILDLYDVLYPCTDDTVVMLIKDALGLSYEKCK